MLTLRYVRVIGKPTFTIGTDFWYRQPGGVVRNQEVAGMLESIARLLEAQGANRFRVRAYRDAANHIGMMSEDIEEVEQSGRLREIPGVGESIAAKIDEYLQTGQISYYEEIKQQFAPGTTVMMDVPGIGPALARIIQQHLRVSSLEDLEAAAREHRLSKLPGIREKTEEKILRELTRLKQRTQRHLLGVALPAAERIVQSLRSHDAVERADPAGSIRRMRETIGDIDILVASTRPLEAMAAFTTLPVVKEILSEGPTRSSILTRDNLQIDVRVVSPDEYGSALQHFTGSTDHNVALRQLAIKKGYKLSEYGLFEETSGGRIAGATEEEVYQALGLAWMPPTLRENRGEIEAALVDALPTVVEQQHLKGDLHVHTDWSDGLDTLEVMAQAAQSRGYEYIGIAEHSESLGVARGLSVDRVKSQRRRIDEYNSRHAPFRVLQGTEVDIRSDGTLAYPDDLLANLDFVTASIHSGFNQGRDRITERILSALRHPLVDVVTHPTGRLIGKREGYEVDLEKVIRVAAETGTALEINSQPDRLDLDDIWSRRARDAGVKLVIDSDAHSVDQLQFVRYGVAVAQRGWCRPDDVLNTLTLDRLLQQLPRRHKAAGRNG